MGRGAMACTVHDMYGFIQARYLLVGKIPRCLMRVTRMGGNGWVMGAMGDDMESTMGGGASRV